VAVLDGDGTPAEQRLSLFFDDARDDLADAIARGGVSGKKNSAGPVVTGGGEFEAGRGRPLAHEAVRHLNQDARAVSRVGFATARAAVLQVDQDLETARDDGVRTAAGDVYDEPNATGIVLERRVIQTVPLRRIAVSRHAPVIADLL
jgi:hypothetical protein